MASALCFPMRSDGCFITGRLPGAKAINALIQAEKNPDNAPARLNRIIRQQRRRHVDGAMVRDMMIQKKSFLVLDWPMRAVNARGHTKTFQMMVNEQGWTNIEERSCYGSSEPAYDGGETCMTLLCRYTFALRLDVHEGLWVAGDHQTHRLPIKHDIRPRQRMQRHGHCVREPRCSFPWWKRGLGYDCQQSERDLQGGRRVGDRE